MLDPVQQRRVCDSVELAMPGRQVSTAGPLDQALGRTPVTDHVADRDHDEPVLVSEPRKVGRTCHAAVVVDDLQMTATSALPARRVRSSAASV